MKRRSSLKLETPASKWLVFVVCCVALAPLSGATQAMLSVYGVRFYELLLLVFILISPSLLLVPRLHTFYLISLMVLFGLVMHSILLGQSLFNTFNSLRDVFWYFMGILLGRSISGEIDHKRIIKYYTLLISVYFIYLLLGFTLLRGVFLGFQEEALLGENENEMMRISFISLPLIVWLYAYISVFAEAKKNWFLYSVVFISCGVAIYFSSSRTIIGVYLIIAMLVFRVRLASFVFILIAAVVMVQLAIWAGSNRFSLDNMLVSWGARNLPFLDAMYNMSLMEILLGKGFGQTIYIPWFELTDFNPEARNLDGLYQTLLIKIGVLGVSVILAWHFWILFKLRKCAGALARALIIIIIAEMIMAIATSYLFQATAAFYGLPVGMALAVLSHSLRDISSQRVSVFGV